MKKFIMLFFIFISFSLFAEAKIYFFWRDNCTFCDKEKVFLEKLQKKYPNIEIQDYKINSEKNNYLLLKKIAQKLEIKNVALPLTIVGGQYFIGFYDESTTGKAIENAIKTEKHNIIEDILADKNITNSHSQMPKVIKLPLFGEVEIKNFSLPLLTIIFGAIDGFNPCAMWVLVLLISFLIGLEKRRMIILGGLFIFISAFVYFMFMVAWFNLIYFIQYVKWINLIIGILAISGGIYYLRDFFINKSGVCKVTNEKYKKKITDRLRLITSKRNLFIASIGIIFLAFAVNLIELICSAGLPAIYLQILNMNNLTSFKYYAYIVLYVFIFMLDDLFIFLFAVFSLHIMNLTTKYSRYSHLIGGTILLVIGILLIFKPSLLVF